MAVERVIGIAVAVSAIDHGTASGEFFLKHYAPVSVVDEHVFAIGIKVQCGLVLDTGIHIAKQVASTDDVIFPGLAALVGVIHFLGLANVAHEPCHSISLDIGSAIIVHGQHVGPVKRNGRQSGKIKLAGAGRVTRNRGCGLGGILPLVEHLCQRGACATRQAAAVTIHGALVVVGVALVPLGFKHRLNALGAVGSHFGRLDHQTRVGLQVLDLALVAIQPELHVLGQLAHIQVALAIGKDFLCTVVTSNNDIALVGINDVVGSLVDVG